MPGQSNLTGLVQHFEQIQGFEKMNVVAPGDMGRLNAYPGQVIRGPVGIIAAEMPQGPQVDSQHSAICGNVLDSRFIGRFCGRFPLDLPIEALPESLWIVNGMSNPEFALVQAFVNVDQTVGFGLLGEGPACGRSRV